MTISAKVHERMAQYNVSVGDNKVSIIQHRDTRNMWGCPTITSTIFIECGESKDPFDMVGELNDLVFKIGLVLTVLDETQRALGDEYEPPAYPFLQGMLKLVKEGMI